MSSKENLFISNVSKDKGSPHPIEEMKLKGLRNNIIIGFLGIVIAALLVF